MVSKQSRQHCVVSSSSLLPKPVICASAASQRIPFLMKTLKCLFLLPPWSFPSFPLGPHHSRTKPHSTPNQTKSNPNLTQLSPTRPNPAQPNPTATATATKHHHVQGITQLFLLRFVSIRTGIVPQLFVFRADTGASVRSLSNTWRAPSHRKKKTKRNEEKH